MKTLLISAGFSILSIIAFGQKNTPSSSGGSNSSQQSSRTQSYQQPAQQPVRTNNYQQPTQQPARTAPAQQPAQQSSKTENSKQQKTSPKATVKDDKKSSGTDEKRKHPKDSLAHREGKRPIHKEPEQREANTAEQWQCPKCGRVYGHLPPNGVCLDDGTPLKRIK